METEKHISIFTLYKAFIAILLSIVAFFLVNTFTNLAQIQKDLAKTQTSIAEINIKLLTRQDIHDIARDEINKFHLDHPQK